MFYSAVGIKFSGINTNFRSGVYGPIVMKLYNMTDYSLIADYQFNITFNPSTLIDEGN